MIVAIISSISLYVSFTGGSLPPGVFSIIIEPLRSDIVEMLLCRDVDARGKIIFDRESAGRKDSVIQTSGQIDRADRLTNKGTFS